MGQNASSKPRVSPIEKEHKSRDNADEEQLSNPNAEIPLTEQVSLIVKRNLNEQGQYLDFPFFIDPASVTYIYGSKVIIMLKGLPGSGKSTLATSLTTTYKNSLVCSADDYFYEGGSYVFDRMKLANAHRTCKEKALSAAQNQKPLIVIDNTNVHYWEMTFYIELAKRFNYVVIAVEPRTPWKLDPEQLAARNSHMVPYSILRDKVKMYEEISPIYYGWFLNDIDSIFLLNIGKSWLDRCWELAEFLQDFKQFCQARTSEEFLNYFSHGNAPLNRDRLLHCTSRFTSRWEKNDEQYHKDPNVQLSIGKVYLLKFIGFVITERTFAARVALTEDQLKIWGGEKEADVTLPGSSDHNFTSPGLHPPARNKSNTNSPPHKRRKRPTGPHNSKMDVILPTNDLQVKDISTSATLRVVSGKFIKLPFSSDGSNAHITLGVSRGVSPATAGSDLEEIVRMEQLENMQLNNVISNSYEIPGANIKNFGNRTWAVYPKKAIVCESIFSHFL